MQVMKQDGRQVEARVVFACHTGKSLDVAILQVDAPFSNGVTLSDYWSTTSRENGCHGDKITVSGYPLHQPSVQYCTPLLTSGCISKVHYWEDVPVMYQVGVIMVWLLPLYTVSSVLGANGFVLQVTAAVHSGCSGGIVVATDTGQPIGMVTSVIM